MSDNHEYLTSGESARFRLSADVTLLMLKGAGYAAVFCLAIWFLIAAIHGVGKWLPDESRETEDPTPLSFILTDSKVAQV